MDTVFVLMRCGDDYHGDYFIVGIFDNKAKAEAAAKAERETVRDCGHCGHQFSYAINEHDIE